MEALYPHELAEQANRTRQPPEHPGYLAQPEMRDLIGHALSLGWTLVPYEAELRNKPPGLQPISEEETSWREDQQARNLTSAFGGLPEKASMLVWCGNHHLAKRAVGTWRPMATRLRELSGPEPFSIDQTLTVRFDRKRTPFAATWSDVFADALTDMGGTAGFLAHEAPADWFPAGMADAYLLSTDNALT